MATPFATGQTFHVAANTPIPGARVTTLANGDIVVAYEQDGSGGGPCFVELTQSDILAAQAAPATTILPAPVDAGGADNGNVSVTAVLTPAGNGFLLGSSGPGALSEIRQYAGTTLVNTQPLPGGTQTDVRLTTLANGNTVLGREIGGDFSVAVLVDPVSFATISHGADTALEIAPLQDGGFVVAGIDATSNSGDPTYFIRNADGSARGSGLSVNGTGGVEADTYVFGLRNATNNGNFVSVFTNRSGLDGSGDGIFFVIHSPTDNGVTPSLKLANTITAGHQSTPAGVGLADGRFVLVWTSEVTGVVQGTGEVHAQLFNANGSKSGAEFRVDTGIGFGRSPQVAEMNDGRLVFTWQDSVPGSGLSFIESVEARVFDPREAGIARGGTVFDDQYVGTKFADVLKGGIGADRLWGKGGTDTLEGGDGRDSLSGQGGNDILRGGADNDDLFGGGGADRLVGGLGDDTYYLSDANDTIVEAPTGGQNDAIYAVVAVNLATIGGGFIEHALLVGAGAFSVTGSGLGNVLGGNAGRNTITGAGGRDIMAGSSSNPDGVRDVFDFNAVGETGKTAATRDQILDFEHLIDDIDLSTIDANGAAAGNTAFQFRAANGAAFTGFQGQVHWFRENPAGTDNDKTIIEGDVNGDGVADFAIELKGLITLTAADFIL